MLNHVECFFLTQKINQKCIAQFVKGKILSNS